MIMANKTDSTPQTIVEAVELLIITVVDNLQQSNSSFTEEDYNRLTQALDSLIPIAEDEENILLTTLINFLRSLIIFSNDDNLSSDLQPKESDVVSLSPHRHENVGRPATLPRLKLSDLLKEETDSSPSSDIDTGPPIGNEVW